MSDTPDFDSMTPEEMMRWMESLAKRQGATEGLTTSADMAVAEVAADDERLKDKGEYIPFGMKKEEWEARLAKEAEQKAAKQAAQAAQAPQVVAPPPPAAQPAPQPVAAAAAPAPAADATPDFDKMSPEEIMLWMESLAVRQGATEGLTTSADMAVAEVSADDERLKDAGEYIPYGMKKEEWEARLAKEAEQKAAKLAAQQQQQAAPPPPPAPVQQPAAEEEEDEELAAALAGDVLAAPSLDDIFGGNNIIGGDDDDELEYVSDDDDFSFVADDDEYVEYADDDALVLDEDEDLQPAASNPMDWLAGLSGQDDAAVGGLDLDMSALSSLAEVSSTASSGSDPMDWLAGLAGDDNANALPDFGALGEADEGSLEWMESLAKRQGAPEDELTTAANINIPHPANVTDEGPGYEPFSFEAGTGTIQEDDDLAEPVANFDFEAMSTSDPASWLDQLASGVSGGISSDDDDDDFEMPDFDAEIESEEKVDYGVISTDVTEKIKSGTVSPEDIASFFDAAFKESEKYASNEFEIDDEVPAEEPVQAEIPEWLRDSLSAVPEPEAATKVDTAEMMIEHLDLDEEIDEEALPDWLSAGSAGDTGNINVDIFADMEEATPAEAEAAPAAVASDVQIDTGDSWVQAFMAEASGESEEWYEHEVARLEGQDGGEAPAPATPAPVPAAPAPAVVQPAASLGALRSIELPVEANLPPGEIRQLPDWMSGEAVAAALSTIENVEVPSLASAEDMDWLNMGDDTAIEGEMPDWLREDVDETVTAGEELPEWLKTDDMQMADITADEIPDWLRETLGDDDDEAVAAVFSTDFEAPLELPTPTPAPAPMTTAPVTVQKSPAPVPVVARNIDVAATLTAAQQKISGGDIDGALVDLEDVVRANAALDQVERSLQKLIEDKTHKTNPAVHRVMGDTLMRQGKLQQALDTYRKALNLL